jgi:hypothetical protein
LDRGQTGVRGDREASGHEEAFALEERQLRGHGCAEQLLRRLAVLAQGVVSVGVARWDPRGNTMPVVVAPGVVLAICGR